VCGTIFSGLSPIKSGGESLKVIHVMEKQRRKTKKTEMSSQAQNPPIQDGKKGVRYNNRGGESRTHSSRETLDSEQKKERAYQKSMRIGLSPSLDYHSVRKNRDKSKKRTIDDPEVWRKEESIGKKTRGMR